MNARRNYSDAQWLRLAEAVEARPARAARSPRRRANIAFFAVLAPLAAAAASFHHPRHDGRSSSAAVGREEHEMKHAVAGFAALIGSITNAQYVDFSRPSDTIRLSHDVPATAAITIEARIWLSTECAPGYANAVWREQRNSLEHKEFTVCRSGVSFYLAGTTDVVSWAGAFPLGRWVHVACQQADGVARIWIDGVLVTQVSTTTNNVWSAPGSSNSIGAGIQNDTQVIPASICRIDWIRVSTCSRYSTPVFAPPDECSLIPTDAFTALLFTFSETVGSTEVRNLGYSAGTAVLGANWFSGATSPSLGATGSDMNGNGIPDVCEAPPCPGDVDRSGAVNGVDLAVVLTNWGIPSPKYPGADVNDDGVVDGTDLATVLAGWGACP